MDSVRQPSFSEVADVASRVAANITQAIKLPERSLTELLVAVFADPHLVEYIGIGGASDLPGKESILNGGSFTLLRWQAETAAWVILFSGAMTFILLKLVGIFVPLRLSDEELEIGDHAIHGNEVYPSDVPTLGGPHAPTWRPDPAPAGA